ncbi:putative hydrolase of the HAD superfamily [Leeuwenhoekiella aestuarii]|uniref:Putative hydrolase of the HAD superfamily n=1 Tax=Leeuwenhoekiella aestuarii TaxID=2249426 RepID=A0A4Q0NQD2_9FLAO|nr:HAD family hydrolase [Leeuwenhoekiella aestuarii]RXG12272.1 putative hydrolase of the HAD superfamily [Leeuwenhoekiella aestuarii]RXG13705.1 putative hydrolase of the HAD superfamily [Leeuwenhoekiella aestuarii]
MDLNTIKVIAFDADDTLWVNETFFRDAEIAFAKHLLDYGDEEDIVRMLLDTEIRNLDTYGYGIKGFTLSMLETAHRLMGDKMNAETTSFILDKGKQMLAEPVEVLPHIEEVLEELSKKYKLVVATKGDLLDQERKLIKSGLIDYFHHVEIVSDKKETQYKKLVKHLDIEPQEFLMIGNSLKSDVIPVLAMGGYAFHIPFHTTWTHEQVDDEINHSKFRALTNAKELLDIL